jgi:hypothetical protein
MAPGVVPLPLLPQEPEGWQVVVISSEDVWLLSSDAQP